MAATCAKGRRHHNCATRAAAAPSAGAAGEPTQVALERLGGKPQALDRRRVAEGDRRTCDEAKAMTVAHIQDIRRRIADLRRMERVLAEMAANCKILKALAS